MAEADSEAYFNRGGLILRYLRIPTFIPSVITSLAVGLLDGARPRSFGSARSIIKERHSWGNYRGFQFLGTSGCHVGSAAGECRIAMFSKA